MAARRWVDVTDLAFYLSHHRSVSGIQRVVAEVLPHLRVDFGTELVVYNETLCAFTLLRPRDCDELMAALHGDSDDSVDVLLVASGILSRSRFGTPIVVESGDVLMIVGAAWIYPDYFKAVQGLRRIGARVVVLLYDLIPLMTDGFPAETVMQFQRYVTYLNALSDRVPAISHWSRNDYERYCACQGWQAQEGTAIRLPSGLRPSAGGGERRRAWPRPFVLFVGTIEARKNHLLAYSAWALLLAEHARGDVPDLVCVGRVGWNANEFLEAHSLSRGHQGKVVLLSNEVSDDELRGLYADCLCTIYPSTYEGWGLPIAESLAFGKPVIAARATSLPEVGGERVIYVPSGDGRALADEVWRLVSDELWRASWAAALSEPLDSDSWDAVARSLEGESEMALHEVQGPLRAGRVEIDTEYGLGRVQAYPGRSHDGVAFLNHLDDTRQLPLTGQVQTVEREVTANLSIDGRFSEICDWGRRLKDNIDATVTFARPNVGDLRLLVTTLAEAGRVRVCVMSPIASFTQDIYRGSALSITLGGGEAGEDCAVRVRFSSISVDADHGGDTGLCSFMVVDAMGGGGDHVAFRHLTNTLAMHMQAQDSEVTGLQAELSATRGELAAMRTASELLQVQLGAVSQESAERAVVMEQLTTAKEEYEGVLRQIWASRSWRIAATVRRLLGRSG
jgi:glycosyltransferase involved in cell wall biosynthesis